MAENKEVPDSNIGVPPARKYANYRTLDNAVPTTCQQDVSSTALLKQDVTMLFQQLVNKICSQQACSKLVLTSCDNAVPTTCQQRYVLNRLVASLLTSCDNADPTTCQQDMFSTGL